jgi:hypothetical protein
MLLCDLRGFTSMAEQLSLAQVLLVINHLVEETSPIAFLPPEAEALLRKRVVAP